MAAPVRERPNEAVRAGRVDPLLLRSIGWSLGAHVLVVAVALVGALFAPEPTRFELPPGGPVVDLVSPRGDSKVFKVGPLATPSGRRAKPPTSSQPPAPPKPEPPKAEPAKPEPPAPPKAEPPAPEPPKPEPPKVEPKPEPPKPPPPKVEPKPDALPPPKPEPKPEPKKEEPKKPEPKKPEPKKEEPKKPEPKKEEPKKSEPASKPGAETKAPDKKAGEKTAPPDAKPGPDQKGEPEKPGSVANTQGAGAPGAGKQTEGGQSGDPNGGGGGAGNRSPEFYAYFAYMHASIKAQWVWAGEEDSTLAATVRFSILPDGTITDVRITERSRSPVYDDSALNAVRATGSLTPPPASVRADFEDVEFVFRAGEMMQP